MAIESQCNLLVNNSNLGPISHRYWDTVTYWLKNHIFPTSLSFSTLTRGDPHFRWRTVFSIIYVVILSTDILKVATAPSSFCLTCSVSNSCPFTYNTENRNDRYRFGKIWLLCFALRWHTVVKYLYKWFSLVTNMTYWKKDYTST